MFFYWPLLLITIFFIVPLCAYKFLGTQRNFINTFFLILFVLAILLIPFLIPGNFLIIRAAITIIVIVNVFKTIEYNYKHISLKMLYSFRRFLFWYFMPGDVTWNTTDEEAQKYQLEGRQRIRRGLIKITFYIGLIVLNTMALWVNSFYYVAVFWMMWMLYLGTGLIDIYLGLVMQSGVYITEVFNAPILANSPRDFWGRRWNLCFRNFAYRNIFIPMGGTKHQFLSIPMVFIISGLLHEYFVFTIGGDLHGYMMLFFSIHGMTTLVYTKLHQWHKKKPFVPNFLAIILHLGWLILTSSLFFQPVIQIFPFHKWKLWI